MLTRVLLPRAQCLKLPPDLPAAHLHLRGARRLAHPLVLIEHRGAQRGQPLPSPRVWAAANSGAVRVLGTGPANTSLPAPPITR